MSDSPQFAITLYVPDATLRTLGGDNGLRGLILDGIPELGFLPPPWWEGSHAVRLGLAPASPERLSNSRPGDTTSPRSVDVNVSVGF
jgi:hypothetical protein